MKILLLDIESAPNLVHVWGLWQQNVGLPQIIEAGYVLCWAAKWYDSDQIYFNSIHKSKPQKMLKQIHALLDEADVVVHYNGSKFDIPTLNKEFIEYGMFPPSPYKQVDLLRTARSQFRFPSNKLDYIAQALGLGKKFKHRGHELWIACMNRNSDAWREMEEYNIQDVILLERVYDKLKPWIKSHPNRGLYGEDEGFCCPTCGSELLEKRGFAYTAASKYQRYRCKGCGLWSRATKGSTRTREITGIC